MKFYWFKRSGLFFYPISIFGWLITLLTIALSIYIFIQIDAESHSVSDTLINFAYNMLFVLCGYSIVAYLASKSSKDK